MLKKQFYVEPQAEVLEVQGEAVICQSYGENGVEKGTSRTGDGWDWE